MKKIIISILIVLSLLGCANTLKSVENIQEASFMVANGEIIHEIKAVELSSTELAIVDHSINNLKAFIDKWDNVQDIPDMDNFIQEYNIAKSNYLAIHRVIFANYDSYPEHLQTKFIQYQESAVKLNSTVQKMIMGKNVYAAAKIGVKLAMVVVGVLK